MPHRHTYMGVIWQYATHTHTYVGFGLRVQACTARLHSVDHPALDSALAPFSRGRWRMVPCACSVRVRLGAPPQTQPGRCGPQRKASCFCEVALPLKIVRRNGQPQGLLPSKDQARLPLTALHARSRSHKIQSGIPRPRLTAFSARRSNVFLQGQGTRCMSCRVRKTASTHTKVLAV